MWLSSGVAKDIFAHIQAIWAKSERKTKIKVCLVVKNASAPSSSTYIRILLPLVHSRSLQIEVKDGEDDIELSHYDACIIQRIALPNLQLAENIVKKANEARCALLVDIDDNFMEMDASHPEYNVELGMRIKALHYIISKADKVVCSTPFIENKIKSNTIVIGNCIDSNLWGLRQDSNDKIVEMNAPLKILYMGTGTHDSDFRMILPVFDKLAMEFEGQFEVVIIGVGSNIPKRSWLTISRPPNGLYPEFVKWFISTGSFDVGIAPLLDNKFNQAKSDIKVLDYLAKGVLPIVSDVRPYNINQDINKLIVKCKDNKDWSNELRGLIINREKYRGRKSECIKEGKQYLLRQRDNHRTAMQLEELITGAVYEERIKK